MNVEIIFGINKLYLIRNDFINKIYTLLICHRNDYSVCVHLWYGNNKLKEFSSKVSLRSPILSFSPLCLSIEPPNSINLVSIFLHYDYDYDSVVIYSSMFIAV